MNAISASMINWSGKISKKSLVFLFVLLPGWCACNSMQPGSDSTKKHIEVSLYGGIWNLASIDEMYSFQKFYGNHFFGGLSFGFIKPKSRHLISFQYSEIKRRCNHFIYSDNLIEHRYQVMNSMMIDVDYTYQRRVLPGDLTIFASITWMNSFNYTLNEDDPEVFLSALAPGALLEYRTRKHVIGLDFSVPVVSLALRDPYYISEAQTDDDYDELNYLMDNLKIESFGNLIVLNAKLHYQYQLSSRIAFDARYQFRSISYQQPRPLRSVSGIYSAGFTINF